MTFADKHEAIATLSLSGNTVRLEALRISLEVPASNSDHRIDRCEHRLQERPAGPLSIWLMSAFGRWFALAPGPEADAQVGFRGADIRNRSKRTVSGHRAQRVTPVRLSCPECEAARPAYADYGPQFGVSL